MIAAFYTLSGEGANVPARFPVAARLAAAARAGFSAVGLAADDLDRWGPVQEVRFIADDHGITVSELEFLVNWSLEGTPATESRLTEERLYAMADVLGSRHINAGIREEPGEMAPLELVAERFAALCDRAAAHGLAVGFEFMPFRAISTAAKAWELVQLADRPNGGVIIDAWHWFRGTPDAEMILAIPPERITVVQLCDGHAQPVGTLLEDTLDHRLLPGTGAFELVELLRALREHEVRCPISVEILSSELRRLPVEEAARQAATTSRSTIERAFRSSRGAITGPARP